MVNIVKKKLKDDSDSKKEMKYESSEKKKEQKKVDLNELRKKKFELAKKFSDEIVKKYGQIIKSVVVFGSVARGDMTEKSDLDIIVIYDDVAAKMSDSVKEKFDFDLHEIAKKIDDDMSIQPAWSLTEFWEMARTGHPLLVTIVRDGWAVYDTGFFIPFRKLLELGKIPSTLEAVEVFISNAPQKILKVENMKLYMIAEDLYYAVLNSAQALLMYLGYNVPSPKNTPRVFRQYVVNSGLVDEKYARFLEKIIEFRKKVEHKELTSVTGIRLDKYIRRSKAFVAKMMFLLNKMQKKKKSDLIKKNYNDMLSVCIMKLKDMGKLEKDPKKLPILIDENIFSKRLQYREIFKKVIAMRKMLEDGDVSKIPERDVELTRHYVDRFIKEMGVTKDDLEKNKNILDSLMEGKTDDKEKK